MQVINALDARRWRRTMYLARRDGPYLKDVSADVRIAHGIGGSRIDQWRALRRYLANERPDLVMSFLSYFTVLSAAKASRHRPAVVFNQQTPMSAFLEDADYQWRRPLRRKVFTAVTRAGFNAADLVIATSEGVRDDLVQHFGVGAEQVRVIPNPVDVVYVRTRAIEEIGHEEEFMEESPVIVAAGRLADAKNYPLMIEAMDLLRARIPARLVILGQGEREQALRALVAARGLERVVTFAGFQSNPWKFIARATVFLLTSRYEGFGNVLIEAMACGVPVVATASAGTRDIVRHDVDGALVEDHSPAAIAAALERVLTDAALRERFAASARAGAERFAAPKVAALYDDVFQQVTSR